jgi:hypothetical protein
LLGFPGRKYKDSDLEELSQTSKMIDDGFWIIDGLPFLVFLSLKKACKYKLSSCFARHSLKGEGGRVEKHSAPPSLKLRWMIATKDRLAISTKYSTPIT